MERNLIDSLDGIDISKLEFSDIQIIFGTGFSFIIIFKKNQNTY